MIAMVRAPCSNSRAKRGDLSLLVSLPGSGKKSRMFSVCGKIVDQRNAVAHKIMRKSTVNGSLLSMHFFHRLPISKGLNIFHRVPTHKRPSVLQVVLSLNPGGT